MKVLNPTLIIILIYEEIGIPSLASSFDPILNLFCHQQIKIARKPKVMQDRTVLHMIDKQFGTMCQEVSC
jgi:hypothetical protein